MSNIIFDSYVAVCCSSMSSALTQGCLLYVTRNIYEVVRLNSGVKVAGSSVN